MTGGNEQPAEAELPPPTTELVFMSVAMRAYVRRLPRKERLALLEEITTTLDAMALGHNVRRIRPSKDEAALKAASVKAASWWAHALRHMLSGVD